MSFGSFTVSAQDDNPKLKTKTAYHYGTPLIYFDGLPYLRNV